MFPSPLRSTQHCPGCSATVTVLLDVPLPACLPFLLLHFKSPERKHSDVSLSWFLIWCTANGHKADVFCDHDRTNPGQSFLIWTVRHLGCRGSDVVRIYPKSNSSDRVWTRCVKLTTYVHLVPWLWMRGTLPPFTHTPLWRYVQARGTKSLYAYMQCSISTAY
jgi:hypothetical protein